MIYINDALTNYFDTVAARVNFKSWLTNSNYSSIHYDNEGGITCYTCKENWQNIRVVFFQPKK